MGLGWVGGRERTVAAEKEIRGAGHTEHVPAVEEDVVSNTVQNSNRRKTENSHNLVIRT